MDDEGGGEKAADVCGVSDVQNPPQPSHPRKNLKPKQKAMPSSDLNSLKNAVEQWEQLPNYCTFLSVLLQTIHTNRCSKWPIGYIFLVGSNRVLHAFYVGCAEPKLLLLVDFGSLNNPLITVLGASAYAEPSMVGCALSVMQTFEHACCSGFSQNCLVEHQLGG